MSNLNDVRPDAVDLLLRPGTTVAVTLEWPTGELAGRTFTSTLDGVALSVTVNGDDMVVEATAAQTGALSDGVPVEWQLLEDLGGADPEPILIGTWTPDDGPQAISSTTVTVTVGAATISVSVNSTQASIAALDTRLDTAEADIVALEAVDVTVDGRLVNLEVIAFSHGSQLAQLTPMRSGQVTPTDHNLVAWAYDPVIVNESALMTNGQLHLVKLPIREAVTVDTLYWYVETVATSPVANQNRVGLYSSAGVRLADVVVNSVLGTTGLKSTALGSVALSAGFVWAAFLFNASTPPRLGRGAVLSNIHELGAVGLTPATGRFAINGTGQTSLPASIVPGSNNIGSGNFPGPWCALST